jgi:hypothetical protein
LDRAIVAASIAEAQYLETARTGRSTFSIVATPTARATAQSCSTSLEALSRFRPDRRMTGTVDLDGSCPLTR